MSEQTKTRAAEIFHEQISRINRRTDRFFCVVLLLQWIGGIIAAMVISPTTYAGASLSIHPHVTAAIVLGAAIIALPVTMCLLQPGAVLTRHVVAVGQMLDGALLIHLSGGRIETHFHVFGSLAFLAFYRDWRVVLTGTVIVALDHIVRGFWAPLSVYGTIAGSEWRWVEHAGWVVFMDTFLLLAMRQSVADSRMLAERQAELEETAEVLQEQAGELESARDRALASAEVKSQFLANMSHEIRTPMNGVIGMSTLLMSSNLTVDQREYVGTIRHSADALLTIINDILDISKIEAGKMGVERVPFSLRAILEDVNDLLSARAREKAIEFVCAIPPALNTTLMGDPTRWRQVMTNLVGNAVKFTDNGQVEVRAIVLDDRNDSVRVRIEVRDTGIGIPIEVQESIFESFNQADNTTSREYGGTGLGLSICRQLAALMGAEIGLESVPGQGSTFHIECTLDRATVDRSETREAIQHELMGKRILIIEDNDCNRLILREQLRSWGCETDEAADGLTALDKLRAQDGGRYDLIVSDMQMPGISGLEVAEAVAADTELRGAKFVLLSSSSEPLPEGDAERLGIAAHLYKPARQGLLLNAIRVGLMAPEPEIMTQDPENRTSSRQTLYVLLAEDNIVNQKVATRMLEMVGCQVMVVANGRQAVDALSEHAFDIVFMDVQMPVLDGIEATKAIRLAELGTNRRQPIVAMTAHAMTGDRERLLDAGMDDYISKPFEVEQLRLLVQKWRMGQEPAAPQLPALEEDSLTVLDTARLAETTGGDVEFETELFGHFIRFSDEAMDSMRAQLLAGEFGAIAETVHTLKGSSGSIAADRMRAACVALEQAARSSDPACTVLVETLYEEYAILRARLTSLQQERAA